jgi:hypothetical protein
MEVVKMRQCAIRITIYLCVIAVFGLSGCATTNRFNEFCIKEKEKDSNFIKQVKYPIDGIWEDVDHGNNCTTSFRIENGIIYEAQNKCYPACSNNLSYVTLERTSPGKYSAKAQYRTRNLAFYDRATTIQVIDEDTLLFMTEARAGMASSRFFLKKRQLVDPEVFRQDLAGAGGEELRKQAVRAQKDLEKCLGKCRSSCENQCAGSLLQASLSPSPGNLFMGQMGSSQCQGNCYRSCSEACEKNARLE